MQKLLSSVTLLTLVSVVGCSGGPGDTHAESLSTSAAPLSKEETIIVEWDETALDAIRATGAGPTVAARALAEMHTAAYDAWTAYSDNATPTQPSVTRQPKKQRTDHNKIVAISYASYLVLADLFPSEKNVLAKRLAQFAGKPGMTGTPNDPVGIGNAAAAAIIAIRQEDASNQLGDITPGAYSDYTGYAPVNTPTTVNDPNRWQPLLVGGVAQTFLTPQWSNVIPFALPSSAAFRPPPPPLFGSSEYLAQAKDLLDKSADLDDRRKVIAEYWADGAGTSSAAGHWMRLAGIVSMRDHHSIDEDAQLFFALGNAMLDASISVWEAKRFYDYVRPITAIRVLFAGKKVHAWAGPNKGTRAIDGATWQPYEAADEVTPASPEYPAEESAFAFAAAEVLRRFTGRDAFGADFVAERGSSRIEPGHTPQCEVRLCWSTFTSAARQAGRAGQLRGVHFEGSDLAGRTLGTQVGAETWTAAVSFFHDAHPASASHPHVADCDRDDEDDTDDRR